MDSHYKSSRTKRKKTAGAILIETALVFIPFIALTLGGIEFMWYLNIKETLSSAAEEASRRVALDHNEIRFSVLGTSPQSLDPLRPLATETAKNFVREAGYSDNFVSNVQVEIDFVNRLNQINSRVKGGGFPQNQGKRLVGAVVSLPKEKMMIFGAITSRILNIVAPAEEDYSVIALAWKHWKEESGN